MTNTYTKDAPEKGSLTVTKSVVNTDGATLPAKFKIAVKDGDKYAQDTDGTFDTTVHYFEVAKDGSFTVNNLEKNKTYSIVEKEDEAGVSGFTLEVSGDSSKKIESATNTATVTNTYTKQQPGSLTVTKSISGGATTTDSFKFYVTTTVGGATKYLQNNGTLGDSAPDPLFTVTTSTPAVLSVDSTAFGNTFTVVEDTTNVPTISGYTFTGCTVTDAALVDANTPGSVTITNNYSQDLGNLKITKTIKGDVTEEDIKGLTFVVTDANGNTVGSKSQYVLGTDFTKIADGKYELTFNDIPVGKYTVEETLYRVNGTKCSTTYSVDSAAATDGTKAENVSVTKGNTATVDYENDYKNIEQEVKLSKVDAYNSQEIEGAELTLYKIKADGSLEELLKWKSTKTVKTFSIPRGDYAIKETVAPEGYKKSESLVKFRLSFDSNNNAKVSLLEGPGTVDESEFKISFKNDPIKVVTDKGGLKITVLEEGTKRVVPNATVEVEAPEGTTFPDGSTKITVVTDSNGQVTKYTGKDGKEYKLTEGLTPGDYKITVTKVPDGYKVTVGKTETVTVKTGEVTEHVALIATSETSKDETPSKEETKPGTPNKDTTKVDTGDHMNVIPIIVIMVISLIASIVVIIRKRKMRYEY